MIKKYGYIISLIIFLCFITAIFSSVILKYYYEGGNKYQFLQKPFILIATLPFNIKYLINNKTFNLDKPPKLLKHKNKKRFQQFISKKRNGLLILPRYDNYLSRSVIDIIDLNNFNILHTYSHDIKKMNDQIKNISEFPRLKIDHSPVRFQYRHPLVLYDGSVISKYGPLYKIDFCSNLEWINDEEWFHHSIEMDHKGDIWVGGHMNPKSKYVNKYSFDNYTDHSIVKINQNGKILYNKSVTEILIQNNLLPDNYVLSSSLLGNNNPMHLNDIEPAYYDSEYWKKGDLFLSLRHLSSIVHYRPEKNKVINYITGPFAQQHDVDIISDKEISIFNNNNFLINNESSEVLIYNFETGKFKSLFSEELFANNFKTISNGLSQILNDGSLMVEEQNHGRLIFFNNKGQREWEFVNKDINGDIGLVKWSRIIEDEEFVSKFKLLVKDTECIK